MKKLKMILPVFALAIGGFVFATQASAGEKVCVDHKGEYIWVSVNSSHVGHGDAIVDNALCGR